MAASTNVPELVIGEPVTVNAEGAVKATEVTLPVPEIVSQEGKPPAVTDNTWPVVPIPNLAKDEVVSA